MVVEVDPVPSKANRPVPSHVLVADPDSNRARGLQVLLTQAGIDALSVGGPEAAVRLLALQEFQLFLCDVELLVGISADQIGHVKVIAVGEPSDPRVFALVDSGRAVEAVFRPATTHDLEMLYRRVARMAGELPTKTPPPQVSATKTPVKLIGESRVMADLHELIRRVAPTKASVLITGESGTGKELVARAMHDRSPRAGAKFVAVNCGAIPAALLESELFGHKKGAFTDAVRDKVGLFEEAHGGTLFLDEIGELPLALQVKLLRVLQEEEIRRIGENDSISVDVRVVAATLRDLTEDAKNGRFREDLYYRLNVLPVHIAPLRDRPEDIPLLVDHFIARYRKRHGALSPVLGVTSGALELLRAHSWPGNIRELENTIERAMVLSEGAYIRAESVGSVPGAEHPAQVLAAGELSIKKTTKVLEEELIRRALGETGGNRTTAAKLLEISHRALLYKIKEYGL